MASSEQQPLKKRRLYEPLPAEPMSQSPAQQETEAPAPPPPLPPDAAPDPPELEPEPPSEEEMMLKRRNTEEIRRAYESYKKIRFCVSQKEAHLVPELEQAYLYLITASRGCTSVQRIVADLIPRYVSYCPTAVEAAAQVMVDMHNWNLAIIKRGEDIDGVGFQTAKACILGLVDICCTASLEASASSLIQGKCSPVFLNVLTFFISSFEGSNIFQIVDRNSIKLPDCDELFSELKLKLSEENEPSLIKLSKFRAISILRVLFACPKQVLAACFELLKSSMAEGIQNDGHYLLNQVISRRHADNMVCLMNRKSDEAECIDSVTKSTERNEFVCEQEQSFVNQVPDNRSLEPTECLLELVIIRDKSVKNWIIRMYNQLKKVSSKSLSEMLPALKECLESIGVLIVEDSQLESDEKEAVSSSLKREQYWLRGISNQPVMPAESAGKDVPIRAQDGSQINYPAPQFPPGQYPKSYGSVVLSEMDRQSTITLNHDSGISRSVDFEHAEYGDLSSNRSSTPRDALNHQSISPAARTALSFKSNSFDGRSQNARSDTSHMPIADVTMAPSRSSSTNVPNDLPSSGHNYARSSTSQISWFCDGDPAAVDIFSASKQLWLGSLTPDISEGHVRFQLDRFGPIDHFFFHPRKGFALVEFRNIMDSIRARDYVRRNFPWRIKFLDIGVGTKGAVNSVAVGYSSFVYIGNISSQRMRDEFLNESRKVVYKGPRMVTDLTNEGALLLEFETSEEAVSVMSHLRQYRKLPQGQVNFPVPHINPSRSATVSTHSVPGNMSSHGGISPHSQLVAQNPADSSRNRMSQLSSLFSSLRSKYNISQNSTYFDGSNSREEVASCTLWIYLPNSSSPCVMDDELMNICKHAISDSGTVVRMTRTTMQKGSGWLVECSTVGAASTVLKNLRGCPGTFFQIEFSHAGPPHGATVSLNQESTSMGSGAHPFQTNWTASGCTDNNMVMETAQAGGCMVSAANATPGSISSMPMPLHQVQAAAPPFMHPYFPSANPWDPCGMIQHMPMNPNPSIQTNFPSNAAPPQFLPPMNPIQGNPMNPEQNFMPPEPSPQPRQPEMRPPLDSSPPLLPYLQPPSVPPPPPSSASPPVPPPPMPSVESSNAESSEQSPQYQWQGILCKSGVHYCTIRAYRVDSDICKYPNDISEPADWPVKLDMTKRTDFRHVRATFSSTPQHRREVCRLIPASVADCKGFQDFISYLKQRECAGVIKIPAISAIWTRLLFILPYSDEICSMLSIDTPDTPDSLVALVLPKETSSEWA